MDYPIRLGFSKEQVRKAQWDILKAVEKGLCNYASRSAVDQQRIRELLDSFSDETDDPLGYAEAFGQTLVQSRFGAPQQRDTSPDLYETCQRERRVLQLQVDYFQNHPLQEQLQERVERIDYWQSRAKEAEADNAKLKAALVREQNDHQATRSRLEGEIAELNRLVVEQQETINARTH